MSALFFPKRELILSIQSPSEGLGEEGGCGVWYQMCWDSWVWKDWKVGIVACSAGNISVGYNKREVLLHIYNILPSVMQSVLPAVHHISLGYDNWEVLPSVMQSVLPAVQIDWHTCSVNSVKTALSAETVWHACSWMEAKLAQFHLSPETYSLYHSTICLVAGCVLAVFGVL